MRVIEFSMPKFASLSAQDSQSIQQRQDNCPRQTGSETSRPVICYVVVIFQFRPHTAQSESNSLSYSRVLLCGVTLSPHSLRTTPHSSKISGSTLNLSLASSSAFISGCVVSVRSSCGGCARPHSVTNYKTTSYTNIVQCAVLESLYVSNNLGSTTKRRYKA